MPVPAARQSRGGSLVGRLAAACGRHPREVVPSQGAKADKLVSQTSGFEGACLGAYVTSESQRYVCLVGIHGAVSGALMAQLNKSERARRGGGVGTRKGWQGASNRVKGQGEDQSTASRKPTYACPAAQRVWRGYEWALPLQEAPLFCDRESTGVQQSLMERNKADHTMCVYLSLLAHLRAGDSMEFFELERWGPVPQERLGSVLGKYSRAYRVAISVYCLMPDGSAAPQMTIGSGARFVRKLLLVPSGDGGLHCLPVGRFKDGATVALPESVREDLVGEGQPGAVERPGEELQPEPKQPESRPAQDGGALCITAPGVRAVAWPGEESQLRWVPQTYTGIQAPPYVLNARWLGGWFPSQCPKEPERMMAAVNGCVPLVKVDMASATVDQFQRHGTSVLYVPVRLEGGLQLAGRRVVTDGLSSVQFFTRGDVLTCSDRSYVVHEEPGGLLRVVATSLKARLFGWLYWRAFRDGAVNVAPAEQLQAKSRTKALWQAVCLENRDATETAILTRMRADAAENEYKSTDAESSADLVRVLVSRYRSVGDVSGAFSWGNCYSCGGPLKPGQNKQRICCPGVNSQLAVLVADGCKVTSHAAPIRYPGVVWTKARHPPLKPGVETVATEANFRTPRRSSRRCRPPPPVMVHGLAGWGSTGLCPF